MLYHFHSCSCSCLSSTKSLTSFVKVRESRSPTPIPLLPYPPYGSIGSGTKETRIKQFMRPSASMDRLYDWRQERSPSTALMEAYKKCMLGDSDSRSMSGIRICLITMGKIKDTITRVVNPFSRSIL